MSGLSIGTIIVLLLILGAEFINGWTDAPNAIATVVTTRVLSPKKAILLAMVLNVAGAFSGVAVATTIGTEIVKPEFVNLQTVGAAMVGIIIWSTLAWRFGGLPTSESHGLLAGLAGAGWALHGPKVLVTSGWIKVLIGLFFSTFVGFFLAYLIFLFISWMFRRTGISRVRKIFGRLQIFSAAFMAYSHGSNDGQKFIGAFSLALFLAGITKQFTVLPWVIILCAVIMGIGTITGGWKIIKTLGMKLTKLEPQHGFAAETAAATAIEIASRLGIPLSTTHSISSAIMGVGAVQRRSAVNIGVARDIIIAWVLTFPACALIAWSVTKLFMLL
jgi:PiT family inorganic phosphate transporter